jgi:hypothetical protein
MYIIIANQCIVLCSLNKPQRGQGMGAEFIYSAHPKSVMLFCSFMLIHFHIVLHQIKIHVLQYNCPVYAHIV